MRIGIIAERAPVASLLRRVVSTQPHYDIAWMADSATAAPRLTAADKPDLIVMAVLSGEMQGLVAIDAIMAATPCPILLVTSDATRSAAFAFEAMGRGAVDVVDLPGLDRAHVRDDGALVARMDVLARLFGRKRARTPRRRLEHARAVATGDLLLVIGASAGGPPAVAAVLRDLPRDFSGGIVVVQHVHEEFVAGMADWLGEETRRPVAVAVEGDVPAPGRVLVAGAAGHLVMKSPDRVGYSAEPQDCIYRPSVDVFFRSVSEVWRGAAVGVLLTGMGRDGAQGLKSLRDRGHHTIAQDESSSAVYGMPKAAAGLEAAVDILPLDCIGARVRDVARECGARL